MAKRSSTKREQIDTDRNKMFATAVKSGHGDENDRPRAAVKKK